MSGTTGNDSITITVYGNLLAHNRFSSGDPGFESQYDFDNSTAGVQTLGSNSSYSLVVNGLAGSDQLAVYDTSGNFTYLNVNSSMLEFHQFGFSLTYLNCESLRITNGSGYYDSGIYITSLDPVVSLIFDVYNADQYYRVGDSSTFSLDTIQGKCSIPAGKIELYDQNDSNDNTYELDPNNGLVRNGQTIISSFNGKSMKLYSGPGHNTFHVSGNAVPEMVFNAGPNDDDFILGYQYSQLGGFAQPIQINQSGGGGHDTITILDGSVSSGYSYFLDGNGTFGRDSQPIIAGSVPFLYSMALNTGPYNDYVGVINPSSSALLSLNAGTGGAADILDIDTYAGKLNVSGENSLITGSNLNPIPFSGFEYLFVNANAGINTTTVSPSPTCSIILDGGDPITTPGDVLAVVPGSHPYTLTSDTFQVTGFKPVSFYNYETIVHQLLDEDTSLPSGWSQLGQTNPSQNVSVNPPNTALLAHIESNPTNTRIIGWLSDAANTMYYSSVGSGNYVRAKYYMYASGQTGVAANEIPNFRLRIANRFAVTSMLLVSNHQNSDPEATNLAYDIRPSTSATVPSIYRVDFDPIDVPQLVSNPNTEGFLRAFEIFELNPQANGNIAMTECAVGAYPRLTDTNSTVPVTQNGLIKSYRTNAAGGGDFGTGNIASSNSAAVIGKYFNGALETIGPQPGITVASAGVTLQTLNVESNRLGIAAFDVFNDTGDQTNHKTRARIEPGKQYKIRFHATSTQASNIQPQIRFRARTIKFQYTASLEIGGATGASVQSNTIAAQALPGVGNQIPAFDRISPSENGGWYNVLMVTPMNSDIQSSQFNLFAQDAPGWDSSPSNNSKSRRDLQFGFDIIDTISAQANSGLERGHMTVDRVDIEKYDMIPY